MNVKPKLSELEAILENISENCKIAVDSIDEPKLKEKNLIELSIILDKKETVKETLLKIINQRKLTTEIGKVYYSELLNKMTKTRRSSKNVNNFNDLWVEINDLFEDIEFLYDKVRTIQYNHGGITIMGFGIIFIPFYNLIAIAIGGYLLYVGDFRSKMFGTIILAGLAAYIILMEFLFP